jgi:hypothetical protein
MVSSLPRSMPKVIDCRQTGAQAINQMITQDKHKDLSRFVRRGGVIPTSCVRLYCSIWRGVMRCVLRSPLPALYNPGGRVTNLETNPVQLHLS